MPPSRLEEAAAMTSCFAPRSRDACATLSLLRSSSEGLVIWGLKEDTSRRCTCSASISISTEAPAFWLIITKLLSAWRALPRPCTKETPVRTGSKRITQLAEAMSTPSSATTVVTSTLTPASPDAKASMLVFAAAGERLRDGVGGAVVTECSGTALRPLMSESVLMKWERMWAVVFCCTKTIPLSLCCWDVSLFSARIPIRWSNLGNTSWRSKKLATSVERDAAWAPPPR
mmetsp:Transcript_26829/g.68856  ORF Transcript_26829/g.68856 Transcript_26829/m.68856 type:complete len:230 (-) Transcript_26829:96-785(-)